MKHLSTNTSFSLASVIWIILGAAGLFGGMANPFRQIPFLALFYPAALFSIALISGSPFLSATLCGTLGASASLYWISVAVHDYGGLPWGAGILCSAALGLYIGIWGGIFAKCVAVMHSPGARASRFFRPIQGFRLFVLAGLLWYLLEWARGHALSGFPWLTLASAFSPNISFLQAAAYIGGYGLSGLLALAACFAASFINTPVFIKKNISVPRPLLCGICGLLILFLLPAFGSLRLLTAHVSGKHITVTMVQGNIRQDLKWDPAFQKSSLFKYIRLSDQALKADTKTEVLTPAEINAPAFKAGDGIILPTDLIVWPETAMPFYFQEGSSLSDVLRSYSASAGVPLLFGAPAYRKSADDTLFYNRCYLLQNGGTMFYDKRHLVPFGEYVPEPARLDILKPFTRFIGGYIPGSGPSSLFLEKRGIVLGPLICYEAIFPELARERAADGAEVFIIISNDAWYNKTSAAAQHLQLSVLRCVEQHRSAARCTNTGISAFIDPMGHVHAPTALFEEAVTSSTLPLEMDFTLFFYIQPFLPLLALALFVLLSYRKPRPLPR